MLERNPHGEQQHLHVEERHAGLDAEAHAGAVDPLQFGAAQVADLVQEEAAPVGFGHLRVHVVAAEELVGPVAGQHDLDAAVVHALEDLQRDDGVDDVAVLGGLRAVDRLAHVAQRDVTRAQA